MILKLRKMHSVVDKQLQNSISISSKETYMIAKGLKMVEFWYGKSQILITLSLISWQTSMSV
jgi:hypothetical protein